MRLLIDEMWPAVLAEQLRERGHDVVAVLERDELRHAPDEAVFEAARREGRAVFTENVADYVPLANYSLEHSEGFFGLVLTSDRAYPRGHPRTLGRALQALDRYLTEHAAEDTPKNRIDWLTSPGEP